MSEPEIPHVVAGHAAVLARRYVGALYEMAESKKELDVVVDDMRTLRTLIKGHVEFKHLSRNPRLTRPQIVAMTKEVAKVTKIGATATLFLMLLAQNRRLALLDDMIALFLFEVRKRRGEKTAEVASAHPLTQEQKDALASGLVKAMGGKVSVAASEDASLLGGFTVKIGSTLVDASLKGKLAQIERYLKSENNAAA
jgi:F-type H+-transporting ATPase subunit delta